MIHAYSMNDIDCSQFGITFFLSAPTTFNHIRRLSGVGIYNINVQNKFDHFIFGFSILLEEQCSGVIRLEYLAKIPSLFFCSNNCVWFLRKRKMRILFTIVVLIVASIFDITVQGKFNGFVEKNES